jgi:hypothetical protein
LLNQHPANAISPTINSGAVELVVETDMDTFFALANGELALRDGGCERRRARRGRPARSIVASEC